MLNNYLNIYKILLQYINVSIEFYNLIYDIYQDG